MLKRAILATVMFLSAQLAGASNIGISVDPESTKVTFDLKATMHTVHGYAGVSRGEIQIDTDSGQVTGEVVVDAGSAGTGNKSRDKKMHAKVLVSGEYPLIVFRPESLDGKLDTQGDSTLILVGSMELLGNRHPVRIPVEVRINNDRVIVESIFEVPYVDWGLKDPSNFALRVAKAVVVSVHLEGLVTSVE